MNVQDAIVTESAEASMSIREVERDNSDVCVTDTVLSESLPEEEAEKRE